ncbi:MAG: hypothetical protein JSU01_16270 [Bacteroidetes bacterium]|nr:hypothetical protein [Bacteroidota bacterium]
MSPRKAVAIIVALLALSCHQAPKSEITTAYYYYNAGILHGRVKQLTEIYRGGKSNQYDTTTTDFDVYGNSIRTKTIGDEPSLFNYKYTTDKKGTKISLIANDVNAVRYSYNHSNGQVMETDMITLNSDHELEHEKYFFRYDAAGNIIQNNYRDIDLEMDYKLTYKYNDKNLLIEDDYFYSDDKKPRIKTTYRYTSFDSKGNWLTRVGQVTDYGRVASQVIHQPLVVRKISYY